MTFSSCVIRNTTNNVRFLNQTVIIFINVWHWRQSEHFMLFYTPSSIFVCSFMFINMRSCHCSMDNSLTCMAAASACLFVCASVRSCSEWQASRCKRHDKKITFLLLSLTMTRRLSLANPPTLYFYHLTPPPPPLPPSCSPSPSPSPSFGVSVLGCLQPAVSLGH